MAEWTQVAAGLVCAWCVDEILDRATMTGEHKARAARLLLGAPISMRELGDPRAFDRLTIWFADHDAAPVHVPDDRWRHVDGERLAREYDDIANGRDVPVPEPDTQRRGKRCGDCGTDRWLIERRARERLPGVPESEWITDEFVVGCCRCTLNWYRSAGVEVPA